MKLTKLLSATIYRDGGSLSAEFETDDGLGYGVFLQCSSWDHPKDLRYKRLYEYRRYSKPDNCPPVITGSAEEQNLLKRLELFQAEILSSDYGKNEKERYNLEWLNKLIIQIPLRDFSRMPDRQQKCNRKQIHFWALPKIYCLII